VSEAGLERVFMEQRPMILRLLSARLGNRDEAEETAQELWLRLQDARPGPIADPAAYLFRMACNLATDRRIAAGRRGARKGVAGGAARKREYPDAERGLIARGELQRVGSLLDAMPERMRDALVMFRLEQRPQKAIAQELGMSLSGVEKLLGRAYRQLVAGLADPVMEPAAQGARPA
jgi:RNA polymerase sigma-70 factor (ECF subfamily)